MRLPPERARAECPRCAAWQKYEKPNTQQLLSSCGLRVECCIMLLLALGASESMCGVVTIDAASASCGTAGTTAPIAPTC